METRRTKIKTIFITFSVLVLFISLIAFPKSSYHASLHGLKMWWDVVFPSLFPFFVISELLISFGVVKVIGMMLDPLMKPLFRVPGTGGVVWAIGMASGYPTGAKMTARMRQERQLTRIQAERLSSFTNCSNPLFMFGAVATVFFNNPALGLVIASSHYLGNFCVGLAMRFYGKEKLSSDKQGNDMRFSFRRVVDILHDERTKDRRPIGKCLGDAVSSSISTLLMIGGFIIVFAVINKMLMILNISQGLTVFFTFLFSGLHIPAQLSHAIVPGLLEITLGSQIASQTHAPLMYQTMVAGFILAFSGFSVQAQVASIFAETDMRFKPFFVARCLHGLFAACLTLLLWKPLYLDHVTTLKPVIDGEPSYVWTEKVWQGFLHFGPFVTGFVLFIYLSVLLRRQKRTVIARSVKKI